MFNSSTENNHYLRSQRLLALAEIAKVTSHVLLNPPNRLGDSDMDKARDAYRDAMCEINHHFKYPN